MFICRHIWTSGPEAGRRCAMGPRMEDGFCVYHSELDDERPWPEDMIAHVCLATTHHTDVANSRVQRALNRGHVELRIVSQDADRVALAQCAAAFGEHRTRP